MYELKRWRIRKRDAYIVKGSVFNNPNFDDGSSLRTSPIISVERDGDTVIFHTMNSTYRCLLENHIVNCDDLPLLNDIGADIISESEISSLSDLLKARDEERIRNSTLEMQSFLPEGVSTGTVIEFDESKDYYFSRMLVMDGNTLRFFDEGTEYVNVGMFQDSVHLGMIEDGRINPDSLFRYFPYQGNRLEFYDWSDGCEPVFIRNAGNNPIEADTPYGMFLISGGKCYMISGKSEEGRIKEPIIPAIDRHSVWEAHLDEAGMVSYGAPREEKPEEDN